MEILITSFQTEGTLNEYLVQMNLLASFSTYGFILVGCTVHQHNQRHIALNAYLKV